MGAFLGQNTLLQRMDSSQSRSPDNPEGDSSDRATQLKQLKQLVQATCRHPAGSPQRQKGLTQLIRIISRQLWHTSAPYYADALQQTWIYFCRNLCEATTTRAYDPEIASPITWLNAYLRRRLQDFQIAENHQRATTVSPASLSAEAGLLDPIDRLPAPPDIPPWLEQVRAWAEADPDDELKSIHIGNHPQITVQLLILKRLPPETSWKILAADYGISIGTLSSFYQRQCLKRLRAFGKSQGYW
ncbi:MAG: sigma-70 family RNA polymerase sigma factor [Phormidesmis sp.]